MRYGGTWISRRKVADWSHDPDLFVIGTRLSPACYIRDAFAASLYLSRKYADDFESPVIVNAKFKHERGAIRALVDPCSESRRGKRVPIKRLPGLEDSSRHWFVWMTLDHLRITNSTTLW